MPSLVNVLSMLLPISILILRDGISHPLPRIELVDGDTLVLDNGERVRLLGIDTPETGQHMSLEATAYLTDLVEEKEVLLESDLTDRDKYDRLLRYVYYNGELINLLLVSEGLASTLFYEDTRHNEILLEAEADSQRTGKGIWAFLPEDYCLGIHRFNFNAPGDDNLNLNDEYVTFRNKCFHDISLEGYTLSDARGATFSFPPLTLPSKETITLHTGTGRDTGFDLFWGLSRAVWNNQGDTLTLKDTQGNILLSYSYGDQETT